MSHQWIFGYGSLIWRPAFDFEERAPAYIEGWKRRFWQESTDHRGTVEKPGRVVTLLPAPNARCWGMAYRVRPSCAAEILRSLDHRERQGYERKQTSLHLRERGAIHQVHIYVATAENPHFTGACTVAEIAEVVRHSQGPSGKNIDYVLQLARALREMQADDEHVSALAALLQPRSSC